MLELRHPESAVVHTKYQLLSQADRHHLELESGYRQNNLFDKIHNIVSNIGFITVHGLNEGHIAPTKYIRLHILHNIVHIK